MDMRFLDGRRWGLWVAGASSACLLVGLAAGGCSGDPQGSGAGGAASGAGSGAASSTGAAGSGGAGMSSSSTGLFSSSSSSGVGGSGGDPTCGPLAPFNSPCADSCGNGVAEQCGRDLFEPCDGDDVETSCAQLGYYSGTASCMEMCLIDRSNCEVCAPLAGPVSACGTPVLEAWRSSSADVATSGNAVAMAWVSQSPENNSQLRFARFDDQLNLIHQTAPLTSDCPYETRLAAVGSNWLIATRAATQLELLAVDDSGVEVGTFAITGDVGPPEVIPGPPGTALVVWSADSVVRAALVDDTATLLSTPITLPFDGNVPVMSPRLGGVHLSGGGYLVTARAFHADTSPFTTVEIVRVEANGMTATGPVLPVTEQSHDARLSADGNGARLTLYVTNISGPDLVYWMPVDSNGVATATPVLLSTSSQHNESAPLATVGANSLIVLGDDDGLDWTRLDAQGAQLDPPTTFAREGWTMRDIRVAPLSDGLVVAWIGGLPRVLHFARLQLP